MAKTAEAAPDPALDEGEAAALVGCCRATLARKRRDLTGPPHFMLGARPRYLLSDVVAWRAAQIAVRAEAA